MLPIVPIFNNPTRVMVTLKDLETKIISSGLGQCNRTAQPAVSQWKSQCKIFYSLSQKGKKPVWASVSGTGSFFFIAVWWCRPFVFKMIIWINDLISGMNKVKCNPDCIFSKLSDQDFRQASDAKSNTRQIFKLIWREQNVSFCSNMVTVFIFKFIWCNLCCTLP